MEIFAFDIILGLLLVAGLILVFIGWRIWRYRGGPGPLVLSASGAVMSTTTILMVAGYLFGTDLGKLPAIVGWSVSVALLIISLALWRKKD
ncbi:MAG: hypothetical protein MUC62_09330 [Candidatus Thermoplasmatota archaeon]|jgi:hypothetical protein|nr:hypothetical protein [Candidatus Thermoplasmatota archaeon]